MKDKINIYCCMTNFPIRMVLLGCCNVKGFYIEYEECCEEPVHLNLLIIF